MLHVSIYNINATTVNNTSIRNAKVWHNQAVPTHPNKMGQRENIDIYLKCQEHFIFNQRSQLVFGEIVLKVMCTPSLKCHWVSQQWYTLWKVISKETILWNDENFWMLMLFIYSRQRKDKFWAKSSTKCIHKVLLKKRRINSIALKQGKFIHQGM